MSIVVVVCVFLLIAFLYVRKKNKVTMTGATLGPISFEFSDKEIEKIEILSSPIAACKHDIITPPLKVRVYDEDQHMLKERKIKLEIYGENGLVSERKLSGTLTKKTNENGIAVFDDIVFNITGSYIICILCENKQINTDYIEIIPPGLPVDFWNYSVGSHEYEERFSKILRFNTNNKRGD